jgi:hypothetical protein
MPAPYFYQRKEHRRTQKPNAYTRYQSYKPALQLEFGGQCIYCRQPDGAGRLDSFGVDHYRPKEKFPDYAARYPNLYYACNPCNSLKGTFWPTQAERAAGCIVVNPCDFRMADHLRFNDAEIGFKTGPGAWTEALLLLNCESALRSRRLVILSIVQLKSNLQQFRRDLRVLRRAAGAAPASSPRRAAIDLGIERVMADIEATLRDLSALRA